MTQWLLAIVGNHCWGRCAKSEAHYITVSLKQRLPIPDQHFKKLFFSLSFWKLSLFHSLRVKSVLPVTPPRLIWPVFFPISQPKTQLKEILTNHRAKGVISSLNALPGLNPLCELQSSASTWEAGSKHTYVSAQSGDLLISAGNFWTCFLLLLLNIPLWVSQQPLHGASPESRHFFLFYNERVHLCWEYSFYQTAWRTIQ